MGNRLDPDYRYSDLIPALDLMDFTLSCINFLKCCYFYSLFFSPLLFFSSAWTNLVQYLTSSPQSSTRQPWNIHPFCPLGAVDGCFKSILCPRSQLPIAMRPGLGLSPSLHILYPLYCYSYVSTKVNWLSSKLTVTCQCVTNIYIFFVTLFNVYCRMFWPEIKLWMICLLCLII